MNDLLQLKGRFEQRRNPSKPGAPGLPKGKSVTAAHMIELQRQLSDIYDFWISNDDIPDALVSVYYKHIVAKSNRIRVFLTEGNASPSNSIRGAKFAWEPDANGELIQKHVFTHYVSLSAIKKTIAFLSATAKIVEREYKGEISSEQLDGLKDKYLFDQEIKKSNFLKVIVDSYYVERFAVDRPSENVTEESIITIYKTAMDTKQLLSKFGIYIIDDRIIDETTLRLSPDEARILYERASYLISMSVTDFSRISDEAFDSGNRLEDDLLIPHPAEEPIVGVIDTQFDDRVYFHEWVEYHNLLDPNIPLSKEDYYHGTSVSSIIVDGPKGNPGLDDGCGRFRVRHFGVATHHGFSSFAVLRWIRRIVAENRDIKVWNLSLGSRLEIKASFISPEAAELDRIQNEFDVIFVVAGTNLPDGETKKNMKIGSPADSLNSLVVNAVDFRKKPASYTRVGPALSFFHKPDVSYYGGDGSVMDEKMVVCRDDLTAAYVCGTSYAAPWISRKLAYLICKLGLSRELAKALIIDSAAGWNRQDDVSRRIGYGVVPVNIRDVIQSKNDEIRFVMTGAAEEYETYTYNLPIPVVDQTHPFYARATLVYFPVCDRNQGVDYTSTEMDIHFGRVHIVDNKAKIQSIDNNRQSEEGLVTLYEEDARKMYRKWDNVKHISEEIKNIRKPRKAYESGRWGLSIKTKERSFNKRKDPLLFGVVVTLKEMNGINRIDEFMKLCMASGWLVSRLNVENQLDIFAKAEEEVEFE